MGWKKYCGFITDSFGFRIYVEANINRGRCVKVETHWDEQLFELSTLPVADQNHVKKLVKGWCETDKALYAPQAKPEAKIMNRHFDFMSDQLGLTLHIHANVHKGKCLEYEVTDGYYVNVPQVALSTDDMQRINRMIEFWCSESELGT